VAACFQFYDLSSVGVSHFPHACYIPCSAHSPQLQANLISNKHMRSLTTQLPTAYIRKFALAFYSQKEPGSSVSIVSGYGLDDRAIEVRSPAGAKDFSSSLCVQTSSEAHPASCTMGTGGPFPGDKVRPRRDADHSPPSSAEVENE
jgi:hypothetical protein